MPSFSPVGTFLFFFLSFNFILCILLCSSPPPFFFPFAPTPFTVTLATLGKQLAAEATAGKKRQRNGGRTAHRVRGASTDKRGRRLPHGPPAPTLAGWDEAHPSRSRGSPILGYAIVPTDSQTLKQ